MSSFQRDLESFALKLEAKAKEAFVGSVVAVKGSVVEGSATTGAPGQPVDLGNLRASWQESFPEELLAEVATNVEYARAIEEGQQPPYSREDGTPVTPVPMTLRSEVGGFHSVKMTRAGWQPLVDEVVREVTAK